MGPELDLRLPRLVIGRPPPLAQDLPRFRAQVISKDVKFGYQLVAVDLNGDGKKDLLAVDERATEVAWFENPTWERHVLATDVPRPLNAACWDIDGDGIPEVILAYRFETSPDQSVGNVVLLTHGKDVRQPWTRREIDRVPTAHRARWIDPEGNGKKVLLLGPMVGKQFPPVEGDPVPIYLYHPGTWQRETISTVPRGVLHAINPVDWDGTARQQLLTASYAGTPSAGVRPRSVGSDAAHSRRSPARGRCVAAARCAWVTWARSAFWSPSNRGTGTRWWFTCRRGSIGSGW